jgi:hypothetical protein
MDFLERLVWVPFIAMTFANAAIFKARAKRRVQEHPELEEGYQAIIRGFTFWGTIPWVVMGIGCLSGGVQSVEDYFRPGEGNPFVLAFFLSAFVIWTLGTNWILFRGGAEMLVRHPGLFNWDFTSPKQVKLWWIVYFTAGVSVAVLMFAQSMPVARR